MDLEFNEKKALVNALNGNGMILELSIFELLKKRRSAKAMVSYNTDLFPHPEFRLTQTFEGKRAEVDCLYFEDNCWYVIEAKQSIFDWYFIAFKDDKNLKTLKFPQFQNEKITMYEFTPRMTCFFSNRGLEIKRTASGKMSIEKASKNNKLYPVGEPFVERSERGQLIQDSCIQTISNLPWLIDILKNQNKLKKNQRIVPIVLTNAKLFKVLLSKEDINENGELQSLQCVESLAFLSFELDWQLKSKLFEKEILNFEFNGSDQKSILISTVDKLEEALEVAKG